MSGIGSNRKYNFRTLAMVLTSSYRSTEMSACSPSNSTTEQNDTFISSLQICSNTKPKTFRQNIYEKSERASDRQDLNGPNIKTTNNVGKETFFNASMT